DLVPLRPALCANAEMERGGPARDCDGVDLPADPVGEVGFELLQLRAKRERAGANDLQQQLLLAGAELRSCERDLFVHSAGCSLDGAGRRIRASRPEPPTRPR